MLKNVQFPYNLSRWRQAMCSREQEIQVCVFGSLRKESGKLVEQQKDIVLKASSPLTTILNQLAIPISRVQLAFVNHRAVNKDYVIHHGDRVSLFPKEYAFFADWKDFRF